MIIGMCERFHCLPSQLRAEDAEIFKMIQLYDMVRPEAS